MAQPARRPELAGPFAASWALPTGRLHRSAANRPASSGQGLMGHACRVGSKVLLLALHGLASSAAQRFGMQSSPPFQRLALPTDHRFLGPQPTPARPPSRLLLPIEHAGLPFVPFHPPMSCPFLAPARSALARLPAVEQQYGQRA